MTRRSAALTLLALTAGLLLDRCQTDEKVSFYGASYIHLSVQEAKSATDISFGFRTHLADAMLLLAAGRTDYCLIKLESGRLKVHINLGAGERELASARELTLNDLSWHKVNLTRRDANITLKIDGIHSVSDTLPGRFFELNINFGVYIGGQGGFNELFLGHTEYLRGCMAEIVYNGIRVIEDARSRRNSTEATAVSWGCSAEFEADARADISFVEDGAFTAIPSTIPRSGSRWELELKTVAPNGLLLFNAGQSSHADFLGIELVDGKIRMLMNKGNGPTELVHSRAVADGVWHEVVLDFTPTFIGISVDGQIKNMSLMTGNKFLDLADTLYIGGAELNKRAKALAKGIKSGDLSYKGCLRRMFLDGKALGLPNVKVSQGLVVNCVWGFPCTESKPCVSGAMCSQLGIRSFKCTCDQTLCIKSNYTELKINTDLPVSLEMLSVRPLAVEEGKRAVISERNIAMILDIAKFSLNESFVVFALLTPPMSGYLMLDKSPLAPKTPFTMHDLYQHKISYHHDGSETTDDSIILKVVLQANSRHSLPGYFQESLRFTLHVNVTPINDPPRLEIPTSSVLKLAQGTRKTLTKALVWAHDADTPAESLVYTVLANDSDLGYVERVTADVGQAVHTFTQAELARGSINYVHSGKNKTKAVLGLKVSDGEVTSSPQYLRVVTYLLSIKLKHNTGLIVVHRSFSLLTSANLSFATNAEDPGVEIRCGIVKSPQYGFLQRQRESNQQWINTDHFTTRDLEQQSVRYLHNVGSPRQDSFRFQVSVREVHSPILYDFNITFIVLELLEIHRSSVNFTNSAEVIVDSRRLKFQTNPLITEASMIVYSLLEGPKYGHIYLNYERLRIGQIFTQYDIDTNKLMYRHYRRAFSPIEDCIVFKVTAPQCSDVTTTLEFRYLPAKNSELPQGVETIHVIEGHRVPLKMIRTNYRDFGVASLSFNLTEKARHGCLTVYNDSLPIRINTTYFTSEELASQSVYYVHDDSETTSDFLQFLALSSDETDFMYIGTFHVEVELRNDNPPKRINQRIFHMVSRSEKMITRSDLLYADEDLGTRPSDIVYSVKQLSNGTIYRINEPLYQINRFTQKDIDEEKIIYKHRGNKYAQRIDFTVNDGELFTNGELEIQAGPAYIKLLIHDGAIVQSNRSVFLTIKDIDVETNVYANFSDIVFTILERPKYGVLLKYNRETSVFDREDLIRKTISYKHIGVSSQKDQFKLKVNVKGAEDTGTFTIEVFPESYWEPLTVQHNNTVYVEEATSVILNRKSLEVTHPVFPASRITYHVKEWPRHGYLEVQTQENVDEEDDDFGAHLVKQFVQNLVNEGCVYYVQSTPNQTHDKFAIDVTNGISWLHNLTVNIVIGPDKLYVAARNLTVLEGKSVFLQESDFYAVTPYFAGKLTDYRIIEKAKHGNFLDAKNNPTKKFSHRQLSTKEIMYKNNGDESPTDYFRMVVMAGEKSSGPFEVWINVLPINDEKPVVVNMTRLNIWQGGSMVVTRDVLATVDNDTLPTDLVYNIKNLMNGYFSLSESSRVEIRNFSQEMINTYKVLFTHTNGSEAEFQFTVSDGLHTTETHKMFVSTKPVRIMVERNEALNVFPLARKPISSELLLSKCTDPNRDIKYFVRSNPTMGKIIMETSEGTWLEVDRFTQTDLNNSRVTYEHNKQFNSLNATDSFFFDIETHFASPIKNQLFKIDISVSSGGLHRYVTVTPVRVDEGGSSPFALNVSGIVSFLRTKAAIPNPDISIRLIKQPNYGHVMLLPDLNLTTYSQSEAESGKIAYFHDHSDTIKDQIDFTIYISPGHVIVNLCNVSVPVDIVPINDEPYVLEIMEPINVVQNQTQTITRANLLTTDPDTGPEDIIYEIINAPNYGRLLLLSNDPHSNADIHQAQKFSQRDIDSSRVVYEHKGPLLLSNFYFRVSDGHHPIYKVFIINVHPIRLNVTVIKPVEIQQGQTSTTIDTESIRLDTNVRQDLVTYEVTRSPKYGVLHFREHTMHFKHTDLLSKSVVYVQQDMSVSNDSLELLARVSDYEVRNIRVPIRVVPLMISNPNLIVYTGETTKLSLAYFDATPLATIARNVPAYKVIRKPKYAKVMRIMNRTMSSGEKRGLQEREITKFSHSQIQSGLVYLVCKKLPSDDVLGFEDSFEFILTVPQSAPRFQPATGVFDFRVKLASDYYNNSLYGPMDPVGHEGEMAIAPNMSNDYTLALGMLLGVFFLGICVIVTIRCRQSRYKDTDEDEGEEDQDKVEPASPSVMPLPRPPDHLLPATPHLKRYTNEDHNNTLSSSTPLPPVMPTLTSTLPQCKVIPLSPMENIMGSEVDVSVRYPYGVADADEWSSFDTSDLPCPSLMSERRTNPMLMRNQYWV